MHHDTSNVQQDALKLGDPEVIPGTSWEARPMAEWRERGYVPDSDDEDDVGLGSRPSAAHSPKPPAAPVSSQESKPAVIIDETTRSAEPEHTGATVPDSNRNDAVSQEVENISAWERRSVEEEGLSRTYSFGKAATGENEGEGHMSDASQPGLSETIEADDALPAASVGDQLQAELKYGLQSVKEILGNAYMQSRLKSVNRSQTSSPLSSIRSLTDDDETVKGAGNGRPEHFHTNQAMAAESMNWEHQNDSPPRYLGRDLRRRNPIQLHPYALEDARYQQELIARGLKPMRVAPGNYGTHRNLAADDTQDEDLFSSSPMNDYAEAESIGNLHSTLHSQNVPSPEVSRTVSSSTPLALFDDDEELPELSAIFEGDISHMHGRKRRKIAHKSPKEASHSLGHNDFHIPELPPADLDRTGHEDMEIDTLEMPCSPPRSGSSNISITLTVPSKASGPPRRMTPRGLPTPVGSSLTKAPLEHRIETEYSPNSSEGSSLDDRSVTGSSPLAADMYQGNGIQSMQRRIKGVLPASWLTLDLDKQTTKNRPRRPSVGSPVKQPVAKGVAQRLKPSRPRDSLAEDNVTSVIDVSNDSSSETDPLSSAKTMSGWASTLFEDYDFAGPSLDDVAEDNGIDAMAPPLARRGKRAGLPAKRQRTLNETFNTSGIAQSGHSRTAQTMHRRKKQPTSTVNVEAVRKHRPSKSMPISLQRGILDAPAFAQLRVDEQPQFLRVAARQARTQRDKGRSGQTYTCVRLTSEADRQEGISGLSDLRESWARSQRNRLLPLAGRTLTRRPLSHYQPSLQTSRFPNPSNKPPSTETTLTAIHSPEQIASLKTSTAATIRRILLRQVGSLASTTLHDSSTAPKVSNAGPVPSQHGLPSPLLSHYQNRSGKGRLTSSLARMREPRSAQLEATESCYSLQTREGGLYSHLVALDHPAVRSTTVATTSDQILPRRPPGAENFPQKNTVPGQSSRKRVPQLRETINPTHAQALDRPTLAALDKTSSLVDKQPQSSTAVGDRTAATLQKGEMTSLRVGTFFHDLTFTGCDDVVKIIREIRDTGWDSIDIAGLVQLLRAYYGSHNMDEIYWGSNSSSTGTREFLENNTELGHIQLPTNSDMGFDAFLKLIIRSGLQKASRGEKPSSLSNFIFSLVPNGGQVLRKDQDHDLQVLRPLRNRHDLYSALYFISPLETKIRLLPQIQSLVDLKESHLSACTISLETLIRLARFQISTDEDPHVLCNFGKFIQEMVKKMEEQFDAARLEAFTRVGGALSGQDDLRRIMRFNQDNIQNFLTRVLWAWSDCIRDCRTPDQARYLLVGDDLEAVFALCNRTIPLYSTDRRDIVTFRDEVVAVILLTITSYINRWLPKRQDVQDHVQDPAQDHIDYLRLPLKSVMSTQLGRYQQCSNEILRSLTCCWHALAKASVDRGIRSWDNYLSPGGVDAWQSFDDTWHKRQYEVYFAALFVESIQDAWREWQVPMLQLWVTSLLVPEAYFKYQAKLTTQIMRHDASYNPMLFHLPLVIYEDEDLVEVHLDELVAARTALVLALLRNMNKSTMRPDSQDSFGPSADDCSAILKKMMAVMRQYLKELEQEPAEQDIYGGFVGRVLSEMRIYTTHLEPVPDDFEYMPDKFLPLAPGALKAKLGLYRQTMMESGMEKHMIVFLHTTAERAAITGQQDAFQKQLVSVFLDLTSESLEDAQGHAADALFRTLFFQNAFPAYLDRIFSGSGFIIARPVLGCILRVYQGLRFRFGLWTREFLEPFLTATLSLLSPLKATLARSITSPERILTDPSQLSAYALLCSIMCETLCRCQEMEDSFGEFSALADIWEYFLFFYKYTLRVAFRPPRALPEELRDDDDQTHLLEPTLSNTDDAMLRYARRELGDILDFKWVPGYGGTWVVNRAGGRKEQVHGGGVGSWEQEMFHMQTAAEKYVRVFAALWNVQ